MPSRCRPSAPLGFVLWELGAVIVVLSLVGAILAVALSESRRQASLGDNFANLKQFAAATGAYGGDNEDRMWGLSWEPNIQYVPGIPIGFSQLSAHANQAIHIIRTRGNRPNFPLISGWIADLFYSHLALLDYAEARLPARFVASPEDRLRLLWQVDPVNVYPALPAHERPIPYTPENDRWPYSSSYELPPAFWSPDAGTAAQPAVAQDSGGSHYTYTVGQNTPLGGRRLSQIAFPSQKVMLAEHHQRHFGPRIVYFMYPEARVPVLLSDGSAAVRQSAEANNGFRPNLPTSTSFTTVRYQPAPWEPPTLSGNESENVIARYRFTRSGLRGRDFGGPEVPWVP